MSTAASSFFRCRLCGHTQYSPVRVQRTNGTWEATSYWKCMSCSVMFQDPRAFAVPKEAADASPDSASSRVTLAPT
jgi:hypothetical protein